MNLLKEIGDIISAIFSKQQDPMPTPTALQLYNTAKDCLGTDMITDPTISQEVGCAVSVNAVYQKAFGKPIGGGASTAALYQVLQTDARFARVDEALPGDIIISPTGTSTKGAPHGHVGIVGYHGIMSNNSLNGLWSEVYTLETWNSYYATYLGFPVCFFRCV